MVRGLMDWQDVEGRLVEAARVFAERGGISRRWAADAPWHLTVDHRTELDSRDRQVGAIELGEVLDKPVPRIRDTREQITRAEQAGEWLAFVPERDRKLVLAAVTALERGARRIPWVQIVRHLRQTGSLPSARGVAMRYKRALTVIAERVNAAENRT